MWSGVDTGDHGHEDRLNEKTKTNVTYVCSRYENDMPSIMHTQPTWAALLERKGGGTRQPKTSAEGEASVLYLFVYTSVRRYSMYFFVCVRLHASCFPTFGGLSPLYYSSRTPRTHSRRTPQREAEMHASLWSPEHECARWRRNGGSAGF